MQQNFHFLFFEAYLEKKTRCLPKHLLSFRIPYNLEDFGGMVKRVKTFQKVSKFKYRLDSEFIFHMIYTSPLAEMFEKKFEITKNVSSSSSSSSKGFKFRVYFGAPGETLNKSP